MDIKKQITMPSIKSYRLTSDKDPSDTFLRILMSQVGDDARLSSEKAKNELARRMEETIKICAEG